MDAAESELLVGSAGDVLPGVQGSAVLGGEVGHIQDTTSGTVEDEELRVGGLKDPLLVRVLCIGGVPNVDVVSKSAVSVQTLARGVLGVERPGTVSTVLSLPVLVVVVIVVPQDNLGAASNSASSAAQDLVGGVAGNDVVGSTVDGGTDGAEAPLLVGGASDLSPSVDVGAVVGAVVGDVEDGAIGGAADEEVAVGGSLEAPLLVAVLWISGVPQVAWVAGAVVAVEALSGSVGGGEGPEATTAALSDPLLVGIAIVVPEDELGSAGNTTALAAENLVGGVGGDEVVMTTVNDSKAHDVKAKFEKRTKSMEQEGKK